MPVRFCVFAPAHFCVIYASKAHKNAHHALRVSMQVKIL